MKYKITQEKIEIAYKHCSFKNKHNGFMAVEIMGCKFSDNSQRHTVYDAREWELIKTEWKTLSGELIDDIDSFTLNDTLSVNSDQGVKA